jgi:EAL domain-containing protein (putative c-di-GMP-specific phosphodiesterase class I)
MVSMCTEMGAAVIGEGVETPEERDALSALGCELHQGFLFARPGEPFPSPSW